MEYNIVFSKRKTLSLVVKDGAVIVRAPYGTTKRTIEAVVAKHMSWIDKRLTEHKETMPPDALLTEEVKARLKQEAKIYFSQAIEKYSNIMGLKYGRIKITSAKSRFGSCNSKGNICFSYRLMLYPEIAREYVVVHELAHLVEMNHSQRFYDIVSRYMPDYQERKKLLKG